MPYRDPKDRLAAKRRYNASPKGKETRRRYYLEHRPEQPISINHAPLAQVLKEWKQ